jgi:hypothetical protein
MPRKSDAKERLMNAAMDLIWEHSYGSTSVDAICEKAGTKKKRFTEQQILGFLKEAEAGVPVKKLCRKHGLSDAAFYTKSVAGTCTASRQIQ